MRDFKHPAQSDQAEGTGVLSEPKGQWGQRWVGPATSLVPKLKNIKIWYTESTTHFYELLILTEQIILTTRNTPIY